MKPKHTRYLMIAVGMAAFVTFGLAGWRWPAIGGWLLFMVGSILHVYAWVKENWTRR